METELSENACCTMMIGDGFPLQIRAQDINKVRGWDSVLLLSLLSRMPSREIIQQKDQHLMAATQGYTCALMKEENNRHGFQKSQK